MSAPANATTPVEATLVVRHLSTPELAHAFSLCGLPRGDRPMLDDLGEGEELCVVCATEYERIRGFRWEHRWR